MTRQKKSILKRVSVNGAADGQGVGPGVELTSPSRARFSADDVFHRLMGTWNMASKQLGNNDFDVPFTRDGWRVNVGLAKFDRLDKELGYPTNPQPRDYLRMYCRGGIAARVVNIWPDECWSVYPELYQTNRPGKTAFERAWEDLATRTLVWHYLHRADRMSRIGQFGVLFLGLNVPRGGTLATPAPGVDPVTGAWSAVPPAGQELNYLRAFHQENVEILSTEPDQNSPRYGQPTLYNVNFVAPINAGSTSGPAALTQRTKVHWTRIVHLADNRDDGSEVFGSPAMQQSFNHLLDVKKVAGASAEMFYKGGFPGYAFQTNPDLAGEAVIDKDAIREEVEAYQQGLQRFLSAVGGKWTSLAPQVANPGPHVDTLLNLICATIGVPVKIFMGSESGHLASTQDATAWKERLHGRQVNYLEPMVVRPFVDRMMGLGILPRVKRYLLSWQDLRALSEGDRADIALKQVQTLMQYLTGQVGKVLPLSMLYSQVMGLTQDQVDAVMAQLKTEAPIVFDPLQGQDPNAAADPKVLPPEENNKAAALPAPAARVTKVPQPQSGGRKGAPSVTKKGRPVGKLEKVK